MDAIIPEIVYAAWCVFWAFANARAIKADTWILHGANGLVHIAVCLYFGFEFHFVVGLLMLFIGRLFFDVALNLFRKKGIGYVPKAPKSKVDQVEIAVFELLFRFLMKRRLRPSYPFVVGVLPKIIYTLCITVFLILQFKTV